MEIDNFFGKPVPESPWNYGSVNKKGHEELARVKSGVGGEKQVKKEQLASIKVSIANGQPRARGDSIQHKVVFDIDPKSKDVVIKVFDEVTGEEIRQIPGEDVLRLSQSIGEFQKEFLDLG